VTHSATIGSLEIAQRTGQRHDNVKRIIEDLVYAGDASNVELAIEYVQDGNASPQKTRIYRVPLQFAHMVVSKKVAHLVYAKFLARLLEIQSTAEGRIAIQAPTVEHAQKARYDYI
jgi:phage regulator Rha-like protein